MNRPHLLSTRKLGLEQLEDKLPLAADVSFLDVGDSLALRIDTADQAVYFQATEDGYEFSLDSGQFIGTDNANVSGNGTNLLTVSFTGIAAFDSIEVDDFAAGGSFHFLNSGLNSVTETFDILLDRMDAGEITFSGTTQFVGSASLNAATSKNIRVNAGSDVSTINGDLLLSANQQQTARTDLGKGISIIDSTIEVLGDADLGIHGTGGLQLSEGFVGSPIGVNIEDSIISGGVSGNVTLITGKGGNRESDHNFGIYVYGTGETDPTAIITTLGSDVKLEGEGGGTGQSFNHKGIIVDDGLVTATGLGEVTVIGHGGFSDNGNSVGVGVRSDFDVGGITSSGGDVIVEGTGGNGRGVEVYSGGKIGAKGSGTVTVSGTGGNYSGTQFDGITIWGVSNSGQSSIITSEGGLITVNGVGGGNSSAGSGIHNGVFLAGGGQIVGPGDVVVNGTGGLGEQASNHGVFVKGESAGGVASAIVSTGGAIEINGWGGGSNVSANNIGICVWQGGLVQGAANSPTILEGTGGIASGDNNDGIRVAGVSNTDQSSTITSAGGSITINGFAGGTAGSTYNSGTEVLNGAIIEGPENEALVVSGVGGTASGGHDQGVVVLGASEAGVGATITSRGGDVTIDGKGGGTGDLGFNRGVAVWSGGRVTAGEMGDVTVTGVGGKDNGPFNLGVSVAASDADARITSSGGDVLIRGTGQGGPSSSNNRGVEVLGGGVITAGGEGLVTVEGIGGKGTGGYDHGILVFGMRGEDQRSTITSGGGIVSISGEGGGTGSADFNTGVYVQNGGLIEAPSAELLQIEGHGGKTAGIRNYGVWVAGAENDQVAEISSRGGIVDINGVGGGSASEVSEHNWGVVVQFGGKLEGPEESPLSVSATGGEAGGVFNAGIYVGNSFTEGDFDATITSRGGDVLVQGQGGGIDKGWTYGVWVNNDGIVTAGGSGNVTVTGTGGITDDYFNQGVVVSGELGDARITSNGGDVLVEGHGAGTALSRGNRGVWVWKGGVITAGETGSVTVEGNGGHGETVHDHGVLLSDQSDDGRRSTITSGGGVVTVTGAAGTGASSRGVYVYGGAMIEGPEAALLSVTGIGGNSGDYGYGVHVFTGTVDVKSSIRSRGGDIEVHGTGGSSLGSYNSGVAVNIQAEIHSPSGNISVTGVGGGLGPSFGNHGVSVHSNAEISTGQNGNLTILGSGGISEGDNQIGVRVDSINGPGKITTVNGDLTVTGFGGGTGSSTSNDGVELWDGGEISSTGSGKVTITGTGGNSSAGNNPGILIHGVNESNQPSRVFSTTGELKINGSGGLGVNSVGVGVNFGGLIQGPVDLDTTIVGQGGGVGNGVFVEYEESGIKATVTSLGGDIRIEATGTGSQRAGVFIQKSGQIQSGGNLTIVGSPSPVDPYFGLFAVDPGTSITASGEILIDGSIGMWDVTNDFAANTVAWGGGVWVARINGPAPESQYDQLDIEGTVELGGLDLTGSYQPQVGESFILIANDGSDAIVGKWFYDGGLVNEGDYIAFNGTLMQVSYLGGDGNDLEMTAVNLLPTLDSIDDLVLSEDAGPQVMDLTGISPGGAETQVLAISATSSNPDLIPTPQVDYSDPSSTGVLHFTPGRNQHGNSTITVILEDGGSDNDLLTKEGNGVLELSFQVTVDSVNDAPTLTVPEEFEFKTSVTNKRVKLSNIGPGPNELEQPIAISFSTDSPEFLTDISLNYTNGSTGNLYFSTPPGELGRGYIYVTVEDGGLDNDLSTKADNASTTKEIDVAVTTTKRSYAVYDHTVFGEIEGNYRDTYWKNHSAQLLQETPFKGFKRSRLEHQWDFDLVGADSSLDFIVNASHDSSSEQFRFQYQLEGDSGWKTLVSTTQNESWQYHVRLEDPAFASDTRITVRVVDAVRGTDDDSELATIAIERIFFQSRRLSEINEGIQVLAFDPVGDEASGDKGQFWFQLADHKRLEEDIEVFYEVSGTADSSDYDDVLSGSVIIKGGTLRTRLFITPNNDNEREGSESVVIRLMESEDYRLVGDEFASVKILDDDLVSHESFREASKLGSHDLNYTQGWYENGDRELIIEEVAAGGKRTRMTHDWKFDLTGETQVMFRGLLEITSEADLDDFQLVYSTDRATWRSLGRITSEDGLKEITRTISLPEDVSDVWVRMFDRYRRDGDSTVSTVAVDLLRFERVISSGYRPPSYFFSGVSTPMYRSEPSSSESSHRSDNLFELLGTVDQKELEMDEGISLEAGSFEPTVPQEHKSDAGILEWLDDQMAVFP